MKRISASQLFGALLLLLSGGCLAFAFFVAVQPPFVYLARDFVDFYSAAISFLSGASPYEVSNLLEVRNHLGIESSLDASPWLYPPWTLFIILPFTLLPYAYAGVVWSLALFALCFVATHLSLKLHGVPHIKPKLLVLAVLSFVPVYEALMWGQKSVLVLVFMLIAISQLKSERLFVAGIIISLCALKPHLVWLVPISLLLGLSFRSFAIVSSGAFLGVSLTLGAVYSLLPNLLGAWLNNLSQASQVARQFANSNLSDFLARFIPESSTWALEGRFVAFPVLGMLACGLLGRRFLRDKSSLQNLTLLALPLSLIFGVYCWGHDFIILIPLHVALVLRVSGGRNDASSREQFGLGISLLVFNLIYLLQLVADFGDETFAWFPIGYLGLWFWSLNRPMAENSKP